MIFADTSFFVALYRRKDDFHDSAAEAAKKLGESVVTTDHVLSELVTIISKKDGNKAAYEVGMALLESDVSVYYPSEEIIGESLQTIRKVPSISMCDALSSVVMRKLGIKKILSFQF